MALTNAAMMGLQPSELGRLTWWEYQALLWNWNDLHKKPEDEQVDAPDREYVARSQDRIAARGLARTLH